MPLILIHDDIIPLNVDALVNAANRMLTKGGGLCGALFDAAGAADMQAACKKLGTCPPGGAVVTPGFKLRAKCVIHAAAPIWLGGFHGEAAQLVSCYKNALALAQKLKLKSIAFPLLGAGLYGYPKERAFEVALSQLSAFAREHDTLIYLSVFDSKAARPAPPVYDRLLKVLAAPAAFSQKSESPSEFELPDLDSMSFDAPAPVPAVNTPAKGFHESLLALVKARCLDERTLCRRANITLFQLSQLLNHRSLQPERAMVLALAVALELTLPETDVLLESAGHTSPAVDPGELICRYFIENGPCDIFAINAALFSGGLCPLPLAAAQNNTPSRP